MVLTGDHILVAPPFIIDEENVAQITERLSNSIRSVLQEVL